MKTRKSKTKTKKTIAMMAILPKGAIDQQMHLRSLSREERTPLGGMRLMTPEIAARLPRLDAVKGVGPDTVAIAKYFAPCSEATWYVVAGTPDTNGDSRFAEDHILLGLVCDPSGAEWEWGYFSMKELENIQLPFFLNIERDIGFKPTKIQHLVPQGQAGAA